MANISSAGQQHAIAINYLCAELNVNYSILQVAMHPEVTYFITLSV
jgi:hypothetical protein